MSKFDILFDQEYEKVSTEHPEYSTKEKSKEACQTILIKFMLALAELGSKGGKDNAQDIL